MASESTPLTTTTDESNGGSGLKLPKLPPIVDQANEWMSNNVQSVLSNEHLQRASTLAVAKAGTIKESVQQGHFSIRVLAQMAGLALLFSAVGGFLVNLFRFHLFAALIEVYTFGLGCLMLVLETSVAESETLGRVLPRLFENAKFLQYIYGRGILYFIAGSLHLAQQKDGWFNSIIGSLVMLVGVAYIFFGYRASRKMEVKSSISATELQTKFKETATKGRGKTTLDVDEFHALTVSLELDMGRHESEVAFSCMDSDHDGELTYEQFTLWWNDKQRDIVGVSLLV